MMLADVCEAAVRAERPATREDLQALVNRLITDRVLEGALDSSPLTFNELQIVKQVFVQVLQGIHHPRISYPQPAPAKTQAYTTERVDQKPQPAAPQPVAAEKS